MNRLPATLASILALLTLLAGCASGPRFNTEGVAMGLTPAEAASGTAGAPGTKVLWGGVIVNSTNLENSTRLEVLGYPLEGSQKPRVTGTPQGRFLIEERGYLETADYAPDRMITVIGRLAGTREGKVGQSEYTYPVMKPDQIHLWPREVPRSNQPSFHFGVGVVFGD